MKKIIVLVGIFMLILFCTNCGCGNWSREANLSGEEKPALRAIDHLNPNIQMQVIDEIPSLGIVVIRFIDGAHSRYIVVKKDQISVLSTNSSGGKNPTYEDESVTTVKTKK
jgi:hypothetical protein